MTNLYWIIIILKISMGWVWCILNANFIQKSDKSEDFNHRRTITNLNWSSVHSMYKSSILMLSEGTFSDRRNKQGESSTSAELNISTYSKFTNSSKKSNSSFRKCNKIDEGGEGKVYKVKDKFTNQEYALKVISKTSLKNDEKLKERIINERNIMIEWDSPFIVKLDSTYQNKYEVVFVMSHWDGGNLKSLVQNSNKKGIHIKHVRFYAAEILWGLEYLHNKGITHRDLKPENILLKDGHITIWDFGVSKFNIEDCGENSWWGTAAFIAPEVFSSEIYDWRVDWWSLGMIIFFHDNRWNTL